MAEEMPVEEIAGPFRLTTPDSGSWTRPIPWLVEVPLFGVLAYLLVTGPLAADHLIPALGVALTIVVVALPGLAQLAPANRKWILRTATVHRDGITVDLPGSEPHRLACDDIVKVTTKPMTFGMQFPATLHLVTDFFTRDGMRVPELTIHHSSYRQVVRTTDVNPDGPLLLSVLAESPCGEVMDLASRTLVELVAQAEAGVPDELVSDATLDEIRAGRLWHARRRALDDQREVDRVPDALILISLVLRKEAQKTAREALVERPHDPLVRYFLAHAILDDVRATALTDTRAIARRKRLRAEAQALLSDLRSDEAWGERATRDLLQLESRALMREDDATADEAKETARPIERIRVPRPEVPKPPKPQVPPIPGRRAAPEPRPEHDRPRVFDREALEADLAARGVRRLVRKRRAK